MPGRRGVLAELCGGGGDQRAAFLPMESKKAAR
jgi:hypothetical protein